MLAALARRLAAAVSPSVPPVVPRRILFWESGGLGDMVSALPALRALRRAWPGAAITALVSPAGARLLDLVPGLCHHRYLFDPAGRHRGAAAKLRLALRLRREGYDLVFSPGRGEGAREQAILAWLTGAPHRAGFAFPGEPSPYTVSLPLRADRSLAAQRLDLVGRLCGGDRIRRPPLAAGESGSVPMPPPPEPSPAQQQAARGIVARMAGRGPLVLLQPGAAWQAAYRCWPPDHYATLATRCARELGARVLVVGAPSEHPLLERIVAAGGTPDIASCDEGIDLGTLMALLSSAAVFVGADSGPLHLARWLGVPRVGLFGATDPRQVLGAEPDALRADLPCSPCYLHQPEFRPGCRPVPVAPCMAAIAVPAVFARVRGILEGGPRARSTRCHGVRQ